MIETFGARTLWAMHPAALDALMRQVTIGAMVPEGLRNLATMMSGGASAAKPADPVRDGASVIIPLNGPLSPQGNGAKPVGDKPKAGTRERGQSIVARAAVLGHSAVAHLAPKG